MAAHVRIRILLAVAVLVIAGAVFGASELQRSAKSAVFEEYRSVVGVRLAATEVDELSHDLESGGAGVRQRFAAAVSDMSRAFSRARSHRNEPAEATLLDEQERLMNGFVAGANRPGGRVDSYLYARFRRSNDDLMAVLADERRRIDARTALAPGAIVLVLSLIFGLLHLVFIERVARRERRREARQQEFSLALQVARSETEAYDLLARHVRNSARARRVTVLTRNNSADRLEAATPVEEGSPVEAGLTAASPGACLAIRLARPHAGGAREDALVVCEVCGQTPGRTTCVPSLVGGEVIGSVLVEHDDELRSDVRAQVETSVSGAAPVIANLRNLAVAELRAATDNLTGLPNQRAVHEALRRMAAQAGRSLDPLALILFDLDHFKAINDNYGHGKGDEVLAAVGAAAGAAIRASDFVGRLGGEEFVALAPATDREGAVELAEKLREAITAVQVPGVDRPITASFGVATLPHQAGEPDALLRTADRALYMAKAGGRDRVATLAPV